MRLQSFPLWGDAAPEQRWLGRGYSSLKQAARLSLLFAGGLILNHPCLAGSGGFETTERLIAARSQHTATLLPDGKVLVTGGTQSAGVPANTAELYDPAAQTWSSTSNLHYYRQAHTATLLPNGTVLVAGGNANNAVGIAELYDPTTGNWTDTGAMVHARYNHTATFLPNGKVLVTGGGPDGRSVASCELYDPQTGIWTETASLLEMRTYHTATLLTDGKVLVAGGISYGSDPLPYPYPLRSAELYDPATETWTSTGQMTVVHIAHTATLLPNGDVLVASGSDFVHGDLTTAEIYDETSGTWTSTGNLTMGRTDHSATLLADGRVLVVAGTTGSPPGSFTALRSAEIFDPATTHWTDAGSLISDGRSCQTATLLSNGKVLIAGGEEASVGIPNHDAELYSEPPAAPALLNISTRLSIQPGDSVMIGGFIVTGLEPKTVIVRGIGPSLGLPEAITDPVIEIHDSTGGLIDSNDNWNDSPNRQQIIDSGLAPTNDLESAFWGTLTPGPYTVVVRGSNESSGLGLFEVYDLNSNAAATFGNISTRGNVQTGDDVLIGGFITGAGAQGGTAKILLRAIGPSIAMPEALADPTLELRDRNGMLVESNDNWKIRSNGTSQQAEIEATTIPPTNDFESAILATVGADSYTAIVSGKDGTSGVGLVEVYRLR